MAKRVPNIPLDLPTHDAIHQLWKHTFLTASGWTDPDFQWGPGRVSPPLEMNEMTLENRIEYSKDLIFLLKKHGSEVTQDERGFPYVTPGKLNPSDFEMLRGILDRNEMQIGPLTHNQLAGKTSGPSRKLPRFVAGYVLVGLALHRKAAPCRSGLEMMRQFFRSGGEFSRWIQSNFAGAVMKPADWLETNRGEGIEEWAKNLSQECKRNYLSWGKTKISKRLSPNENKELDIRVERLVNQLWTSLISATVP